VSVGLALALAATWLKQEFAPTQKETSIYVYNGLGTALTVTLDGTSAFLGPRDRMERRVKPGVEVQIRAATESGTLVESLLTRAPGPGEGSLVYSVAGAAPFVEWTASYGPEPGGLSGERVLGAPRIFTSRADYILTLPPGTLKLVGGTGTRLSLNPLAGVHPDVMLSLLGEPSRRRLVRTHARWDAPDQTFLPLWLSLAVSQDPAGARELLLERRRERPDDLWTLRELLRALDPEGRTLLCGDISAYALESPEDPGFSYLSALCAPPESLADLLPELSERFPGDPFVSRALGLKAFNEGNTAKALELLFLAFAEDPRVMLLDIDLLARLSRLEGMSQAEILAEIGPWSPVTRRLAEAEGSEEPGPQASGEELSLRLLHLGRPADALNAAPEPLRRDMLLFAAASDGASPGLLDDWRENFTPEYLSARTAWCDWGLSVREGGDRSRSEAFILANSSDQDAAREAFGHILNGDWEGVKAVSQGRDPRFQGQLALAAALVWRSWAPEEARHVAKSYLYIGERPYLN
jgi:hypothetical protein